MSFTLIIVVITAIVSFSAFSNIALANKLIFYPYEIARNPSEYYRFVTSGFIHADWNHLLFNMISLYFFGTNVEEIFKIFGFDSGYAILYVTAIIVSSYPSFIKHREHSYYRSLGASGGVSAIIFATVYFEPWNKIFIYFIPIGIPSVIFAVLYLVYSGYMSKRGGDNIGHDAHFWGAVYGFAFAFMVDFHYTGGHSFINQMLMPLHR